MDAIPARDRAFELIVAHGIWNLARSSAEFRRAVAEAARVAVAGADRVGESEGRSLSE